MITDAEYKALKTRLEETLKEIANKPIEFWWGDKVRTVKHIHDMTGEYTGCIIYLFPRWHDKHGSANISFDTQTGYIEGTISGSMNDIELLEINNHDEFEIMSYWEQDFLSTQ